MKTLPHNRIDFLIRYFSSGWAFLIPYLSAYLIYFVLKWPVNPGSVRTLDFGSQHIPSLLHVFWALHFSNLLLASLALRAWLFVQVPPKSDGKLPPSGTRLRGPTSKCIPWVLLWLLFFIPGAYLEFPADPWEHLRRINDWSGLLGVGSHPEWQKSGYFLIYSLIGRASAGSTALWIDAYFAGICLLVCWQYYKLALAVGLESRWALMFVLLQTLVFGNSIFSFYRYYGISTTTYSQLGAIAILRMAIQVAGTAHLRPLTPGLGIGLAVRAACLILLVAFNHAQGLGIALLGLMSVLMWRIVAWRPRLTYGLAIAALGLSWIAVYWLPRNHSLDVILRQQGWLAPWYGFNLLSPQSFAAGRMIQILGAVGLANLLAGLLLIRSNSLVGWITVIPLVALSLPFVAIPFAGVLFEMGGWRNIAMFHRMFLAVPAGLALVELGRRLYSRFPHSLNRRPLLVYAFLIVGLAAATTLPPSDPSFNRFWHAFERPADDLCMRSVSAEFASFSRAQTFRKKTIIGATTGISFVLSSRRPTDVVCAGRSYSSFGCIPAYDMEHVRAVLPYPEFRNFLLVVAPSPVEVFTPYSLAALLSSHWEVRELPYAFIGSRELGKMALDAGLASAFKGPSCDYFQLPTREHRESGR